MFTLLLQLSEIVRECYTNICIFYDNYETCINLKKNIVNFVLFYLRTDSIIAAISIQPRI